MLDLWRLLQIIIGVGLIGLVYWLDTRDERKYGREDE